MRGTGNLSIPALRERIARGELTHEALIQQVLEAAALPSAQHVFTKTYADAALAAARHADAAQKAGVQLGALAGLPVSVKDLYDVAGETTMAGSAVCKGEQPAARDAVAVARLRTQGAAIVGKTNMTEFAFSGVGINPHYGTPRNPADADTPRIPGGSSSGAAVSVALGLAVAGLGSDTGGSIRIPAALCGLVGFKSTQSRVPRTGAFELARSLDTVCAMARSVEDCLVADAAIADAPLVVRRRPLRGLRLAVPRTLMFDGIEPAIARAFERSVQALSAAGAEVVEITLAELAEIASINAPGGFSPIEASAVHRERFTAKREGFDSRVAARIALGTEVRAADYIVMQDRRRDWIGRVEHALEGFDALICPTVPIVAPSIASLAEDAAFFQANGLLLRNTFAINFLDGCAFSLPCHAPDELPVGLMLSSVRGDDARLAAVALAVEQALR
ncbi:aspartyl-tRNA(Asn)/glutamyl-tRNA(Gln) amidotransferase subunit A [Variovorax boronicumulans]|uniref:Aspartyl-tRNA(Asn)/glutamyl-tRNA(Gln) amidotransferase subunit A n=1 Tax=Variovorax boronicumulans TaxID=436515 RepID=A0AAW8CYD1_9BURK|nr:amidase [Variovorax boronicumulans]MDP9892891.1 aspartyl-tRNA(Asn)/glutamyl-tRNA(Gln) amidotransferase subunit A [Variovorax boronicumulans]MDQ0052762.1 aspartyl-tRNA(Asn)/glutamyl-tRNA(Gln) amidotransferase subunit A [Variovorax boronicumulans]